MNYIKIDNISKSYSIKIFSDLHFTFEQKKPCAVTGPNGSGKSTLINILSLKFLPDAGVIKYVHAGTEINEKRSSSVTGIVSPYFNPYEEMNMRQTAQFVSFGNAGKLKSICDNYRIFHINENEKFGNLSEGFKQRAKICLAFTDDVQFLLLDEPFNSLDEEGRLILENFIEKKSDCVIVTASNDKNETGFCSEELNLG
ncbi:MAG: ATP-binding cassette domain-containing protein [Spirochaetes bacterium]|nr:ATP-binding cassette domain-containing protein [Spirochaetota bacterium]